MFFEHYVRRYPLNMWLWEHSFSVPGVTFSDLDESYDVTDELLTRALKAIADELSKQQKGA